jgi:polar amino acid transport system substrate-binding protein
MQRLVLFAVFISLSLHPLPCCAGEETPYYIVEDPWPPYTYGETGQTPERGFAIELMHAVFDRLQLPIRMELLPWKRCVVQVKSGKADALMLTVPTKKRQQFFSFAEPFFSNSIVFIHRRGESFNWKTISDLKKYRLGLVNGAEYSQEFNNAVEHDLLDVQQVATIEQNLDKLAAGRIDATPVLDVVARELIKLYPRFQDRFSFSNHPLKTTDMHMALSRKSRLMAHAERIDKVIRAMKADGTIDAIMSKLPTDISGLDHLAYEQSRHRLTAAGNPVIP